jgi:hypothetical protein
MVKMIIILISWADGSVSYKICDNAKMLAKDTETLKSNKLVEYYEVVYGESVHLWANPNCTMED